LRGQTFLSLLQVFLDPFGLTQQKRDVHLRGGEELLDDAQRLLELLDELHVFLVAPRVAQAGELAVQDGQGVLEFGVELLEAQGEASQFRRVNDRLRHEATSRDVIMTTASLWQCRPPDASRREPKTKADGRVRQDPSFRLSPCDQR